MLDFLDSGGTTVRELLAAHGSGNASQMAALAHRLKSSAAAVGAVALSHTCQALESAGRARDWTQIERLLDDCSGQFHEVADWIHADA
jgi:HPt (histidine-containing phosphotransfer) domain-containing protein